jgi:hypothetical protein
MAESILLASGGRDGAVSYLQDKAQYVAGDDIRAYVLDSTLDKQHRRPQLLAQSICKLLW